MGWTDEIPLSVFDLLGVYQPAQKKIVVYRYMCEIVANQLGIDPQILQRIVHAHERAHFVTHRGIDQTGNEWPQFELADERQRSTSPDLRIALPTIHR